MRDMRFSMVLALAVGGCGVQAGRHGGEEADLSVAMVADAGAPMGPCDDKNPCPTGKRCFAGACIPDNGTCQGDDDCENDTWCDCAGGGGGDLGACMGGVCIPWGTGPRGLFDPDCHSAGFPGSQFVAPKLKCSWTQGEVMSTPIVADLDGDGKPEIVFPTLGSHLVALHGGDCSVYFDKAQQLYGQAFHIAVADLDGDGKPEIVGITDRVVVWDNQGNLVDKAPSALVGAPPWGAIAIANVDNQAPPEIIVGAQVLRYANKKLSILWSAPQQPPSGDGQMTIVADLDGDHKPEVISGRNVYDGITGADKTPAPLKQLMGPGGYAATGDFNHDGKPELAIIQSDNSNPRVSIYDFSNQKFLFGPFDLSTIGNMFRTGAPTVADFDGDGTPEFGSAGPDNYYVFHMKCQGMNKPMSCDQTSNVGILWKKRTQDKSSGFTGSSVFDFNGDGKAEVVYRDECWLRVYSGPDGKTIFATPVSSWTSGELPVIADVDGDGHADIVTSSDDTNTQTTMCDKKGPESDTGTPWTAFTHGILVFQDPMNRWMPSRKIWNQHSYHITNINDDLSVPAVEKDNWLTFNNYRQNVQGLAGPGMNQPDFTGGVATGIDNGGQDCKLAWRLHANLCNRGAQSAPAGIAGAFYASDPRQGKPPAICTTKTTKDLPPGSCESVSCDWKGPPQGPTDVWFRADDDGSGAGAGECKGKNDLLILPQAMCTKIG